MGKIQKGLLFILSFSLFLFSFWGCKTETKDEAKSPITTSSNEARDQFLKGRQLAENLQGQESLQYFSNAIKADPDFALAYLNRAVFQPSANEFFSDLNKAVSLTGKVSNGERLQILGFEAGTNADLVKQKEFYDTLVSQYPNDERALALLGTYYYTIQDYKNAADEFNKAVEIDSTFAPAYNMIGYSEKQLMNYDAAEKAFQKYIQLIPNDPNPYDSYAELLLKEGKYDQSISNYEKALSFNPHFVSSILGIAANKMYQGKYDEARAVLEKLYNEARGTGEKRNALFAMAVTFVDEGKSDMALNKLKKQYDLDEKGNDHGSMTADLINMANILLEMGKNKEALENYQKAVETFNSSASSQQLKDNVKLGLLFNEADVALRQKDFKTASSKAEEYMNGVKAINNFNQIQLAHQLHGMIALAQKKADDCLSHLSRANQEDPYNLYRMSVAYQMKGDKEKAKEYCQKAINFNSILALNSAIARNKAKKMMNML